MKESWSITSSFMSWWQRRRENQVFSMGGTLSMIFVSGSACLYVLRSAYACLSVMALPHLSISLYAGDLFFIPVSPGREHGSCGSHVGCQQRCSLWSPVMRSPVASSGAVMQTQWWECSALPGAVFQHLTSVAIKQLEGLKFPMPQ